MTQWLLHTYSSLTSARSNRCILLWTTKAILGVSLGRRMLMSACIRAQMTFFHFSFHDFRRQDNSDAGALMGDNWQDKLPT